MKTLQNRLEYLEEDNRRLNKAAVTADRRHAVDIDKLAGMRAVVAHSARREGGETAALAASRAENRLGEANLLASKAALASAQAQTKIGVDDLLASAAALATSRAQVKISLADLLESAVALASSRAETEVGRSDLRASVEANEVLSLANGLLITNEAALEALVETRTAALTREVEERRRAEAALRQGEKLQAIGELTGGIAHDLNNILQTILSGTGLMRRASVTEERRAYLLDSVDHATERAGQLIARLLAFARKQVLQPRAFDLNVLIGGMTELLVPSLGPKLRLVTSLSPDLWPVVADPGQLEVAILNLAVNARDAMQPDGGTFLLETSNVTLEAAPDRAAGDYLRLTVRDSGPGMSPKVVARMFEPYFTTKPSGKGTGLGLAQVWGFAKQSGGEVLVVTAPGEGTAFHLHFPRPTAAALKIAARVPLRDAGASLGMQEGDHRTILVVEDNPDLSALTLSLLEDEGYTTLRAANAAEALAILAAGTPVDAVFSDVVMPGPMNGVELAELIQQRYPGVAVTLATGYSDYLAQAKGPLAVEVLAKPYRVDELTAALARAFRAVAERAPARTAPASRTGVAG